MSETNYRDTYVKELEDNLLKVTWKTNFYEKHFKHLVCHHGYEEGNYCNNVSSIIMKPMRPCWFCKLPFCLSHIATCQKCFHITCHKCLKTHDCCDHTQISDAWMDGCANCARPLCAECFPNHHC